MTYEELLKKYDRLIITLAKRVDQNHWQDCAQDMRLFVLQHYKNYNPNSAPEDYYVKMMILTAYRKQIFDRTKQQKFENGFVRLIENVDVPEELSNYEYLLETIVSKLVKPKDKIVFYSIVYNSDDSNYKELSQHLKMNYMSFLSSLNKIKKIVRRIQQEESVL